MLDEKAIIFKVRYLSGKHGRVCGGHKIEILVTPSILFNLTSYQYNIDLIKIIFPRHNKSLKTRSLPVYMQNLSLLI
jgi:hypothetical protein